MAQAETERPAGVRVLVVDDEPSITDAVATAFRYEGFDTNEAGTGRAAVQAIDDFRPDLIILDVMLPDLDGIDLARRLRDGHSRTPIIFLTARDATEDKLAGLAVGDDYLTKPFSIDELVARVRAILRRTVPEDASPARLRYFDLEIDEETRDVLRCGRRIELSPTEYVLLRYLLVNARRIMSKAQILDHVWQYNFGGDGRIVETYISYLRKKVDVDAVPLIHTVRGVGYVLRHPED